MHNTLVKVYGFLRPCKKEYLPSLEEALRLLGEAAGGVLSLDGDLLNISYEGPYFPIDDVLKALAACLSEHSEGRVDYIDMEDWTLHRYNFENGFITSSKRDLNSVLAYSGH